MNVNYVIYPFVKDACIIRTEEFCVLWAAIWTSSSAVAKRLRDASCLSVVSFNSAKRPVESFYC